MYSFMTAADLNDDTVFLFTKNFTLENWATAWQLMNYGVSFFKTATLVLFYTLFQTAAVTFIAYGLARFRFPGRSLLFVISIIVAIAVIIFLFFDLKKTKNSKVLINNRRKNK